MEKIFVDVADLFELLGLPSDEKGIAAFVTKHAPLSNAVRIEDAPFWSKAQATLLKDGLLEDGYLASAVDQLNALMRL
ncbi:MAG: DUF2789 domain-containing protein [Burkholderiales bacterium]|nr:DUF2789 domain-containing protein [Burkholderiales bacterium]